MDSVSYRFEQSILHFEDEYFYWHPGFNPFAITKALWENLTTEGRLGGSTLTQQVIRLSRKNQERTYWEKVIEIFQATRLELRFSKKEIQHKKTFKLFFLIFHIMHKTTYSCYVNLP